MLISAHQAALPEGKGQAEEQDGGRPAAPGLVDSRLLSELVVAHAVPLDAAIQALLAVENRSTAEALAAFRHARADYRASS